jgi:hypothetical protein
MICESHRQTILQFDFFAIVFFSRRVLADMCYSIGCLVLWSRIYGLVVSLVPFPGLGRNLGHIMCKAGPSVLCRSPGFSLDVGVMNGCTRQTF